MLMVTAIRPRMMLTRITKPTTIGQTAIATRTASAIAVRLTVMLMRVAAGRGMLMVTLGVLMPMGVVSRPRTVLTPLTVRIVTALAVAPMLMLAGTGLTVTHLQGTSAFVTPMLLTVLTVIGLAMMATLMASVVVARLTPTLLKVVAGPIRAMVTALMQIPTNTSSMARRTLRQPTAPIMTDLAVMLTRTSTLVETRRMVTMRRIVMFLTRIPTRSR